MKVKARELLRYGLLLVNFDEQQLQVAHSTNIERFIAHFGSTPVVLAKIWNDLESVAVSRVHQHKNTVRSFLMSMHFLKCYQTSRQLEPIYKLSEKTIRAHVWFFVERVQALKDRKVRRHAVYVLYDATTSCSISSLTFLILIYADCLAEYAGPFHRIRRRSIRC
jgi:hypothetical protein